MLFAHVDRSEPEVGGFLDHVNREMGFCVPLRSVGGELGGCEFLGRLLDECLLFGEALGVCLMRSGYWRRERSRDEAPW